MSAPEPLPPDDPEPESAASDRSAERAAESESESEPVCDAGGSESESDPGRDLGGSFESEAVLALTNDQLIAEPSDAPESVDKPPLATPVRRSSRGPLLLPVRGVESPRHRLAHTIVFLATAGILGLAAWLEPNPDGLGTHRQMGFPPCNMILLCGYPCPTCGMTTAFAHTVRGQFLSAFRAQPAGLLACLVTAWMAFMSLAATLGCRRWTINWYRVSPMRLALIGLAVVLLGWLYKVAAGCATNVYPLPHVRFTTG
jgi:hypothetical protein